MIIWPSRHLTDEEIDAVQATYDDFYDDEKYEEWEELYDGMTDYLEDRYPDVYRIEQAVRDVKTQVIRHGYRQCWGARNNLYQSLKFLYEEDGHFAWVQGFLREQSALYVKDEETEWRVQLVTNGYVADDHEDKLVGKYGWTKLESSPANWEEAKAWLREHVHSSLYFVSTNNRRYAPHLGFKYAKDAAAFKLVWL